MNLPLPPPPIPSHPSVLVSGKGAIGTATQNQMKNVLECRQRSELTPLQQRMNSYTPAQRAELGKSALALIAKAAKRGRVC